MKCSLKCLYNWKTVFHIFLLHRCTKFIYNLHTVCTTLHPLHMFPWQPYTQFCIHGNLHSLHIHGNYQSLPLYCYHLNWYMLVVYIWHQALVTLKLLFPTITMPVSQGRSPLKVLWSRWESSSFCVCNFDFDLWSHTSCPQFLSGICL